MVEPNEVAALSTKVHGLLALIPLNDDRLKRRRTYIWIIFIVAFFFSASLTAIFIIYPRNVKISDENQKLIDVTNSSFRNDSVYHLSFDHKVSIRSFNLLPIRLINVSISIEHHLVVIKTNAEKIYSNRTYLPSSGQSTINLKVDLDFDNETMIYEACQGKFRQILVFKLKTTFIYTDFLVGRLCSTNNDSFQYVLCNRAQNRD